MRTSFLTAMSALTVLGASACSEKAADNLENAGSAIGSDVGNTVDRAGDRIERGLDEAGNAIDEGSGRLGAAMDNASRDAERERAKRSGMSARRWNARATTSATTDGTEKNWGKGSEKRRALPTGRERRLT
ncbi:hypothetical protein [Sphingobium fuliginis]|uniref:hypothetical protein n=1 Tax=Sphingobium fuliginis (strain ATCC 27551) TaxID=336203 RepID=UPI00040BFE17